MDLWWWCAVGIVGRFKSYYEIMLRIIPKVECVIYYQFTETKVGHWQPTKTDRDRLSPLFVIELKCQWWTIWQYEHEKGWVSLITQQLTSLWWIVRSVWREEILLLIIIIIIIETNKSVRGRIHNITAFRTHFSCSNYKTLHIICRMNPELIQVYSHQLLKCSYVFQISSTLFVHQHFDIICWHQT